jgi:hypothetical protein
MSFYTRPVTTSLLDSGLVGTLGVTVVGTTGDILVTRITATITEQGSSAIYQTEIPNFNSAWFGMIVWDVSGNVVAQEEFLGDVSTTTPLTTPIYSPSVNSYITVFDAGLYFDTRLETDAWDNATDSDRTKALAQATRAIDRLNFIGIQASPNQQYQWPRIIGPRQLNRASTGILPPDIQIATAELALNYLDGVDPDLEDELLGSIADAYATVRVTSNPKVARDHIKAGIVSITAWRLLLPWLNDPRSIHMRKG